MRLVLACAVAFPAGARGQTIDEAAALISRETPLCLRRLSINRCALGPASECFKAILLGLAPEDRAHVRLVTAGPREGSHAGSAAYVLVDPGHRSDSGNFTALRRIANEPRAMTVSDILAPADRLTIKSADAFPARALATVSFPMGHPDTNDGFLGYTFFEYRGAVESGILYSAGPYNHAVVNAGQGFAALSVSVHHEFRHVVLGDFGRSAPSAKHGDPAVDAETDAAEREARANASTPL